MLAKCKKSNYCYDRDTCREIAHAFITYVRCYAMYGNPSNPSHLMFVVFLGQ